MALKKSNILLFRQSPWYIVFIIFFLLNALLSMFFSIGILGTWNFYTNISESMYPTIKRGDLAIVKRTDNRTYQVGDMVSFYRNVQGTTEVITHRIHRIGGNVYITKGDNNTTEDSEYLIPRMIIGKVQAVVPNLGSWIMFLKSLPGRVFFIVTPMIIIISTELQFLRQKNKK